MYSGLKSVNIFPRIISRTFAPSKSRENIKKDWRKKRGKKLVEINKGKMQWNFGV